MARRKRLKTRLPPVKPTHSLTSPTPPWVAWLCLGMIVVIGLVFLGNSLIGVFVYDDAKWVVAMGPSRSQQSFLELLKTRRSWVNMTLALNYAIGELNPRGYHVVNLIIHLLAGLVLFGIVRRTIMSLQMRSTGSPAKMSNDRHNKVPRHPWAASPHGFALAAALLWLVHPLQTQSVTYVIQRGESMMGLFYLLTLYCVIRGAMADMAQDRSGRISARRPGRSILWHLIAVVACAMGMGCKAVMISAPIVLLIYDRVFLAGSFRTLFRRRWFLYLGLFATWMILVENGVTGGIVQTKHRATIGFGTPGISGWDYALTQPGVILHYLRLTFWPSGQVIDYGWPVVRSIKEAFLPGMGLLLLLAATVWALWKKPVLGFCGVWFFAILSPTSSFIPIKDPIYEHRMYLSLAAIVVLVLAYVWHVAQRMACHRSNRIILPVVALLTILLGICTFLRNRVYYSELAMWYDVVAKRPLNARAHNNLGKHLLDVAKMDPARLPEAIDHLRTAVRLDESFASANYNLGNGLSSDRQYDEAIRHYQKAIALNPHFVEAFIMMGNAFTDAKKLAKAEQSFRDALKNALPATDPILIARSHFNLGNTLFRMHRYAEAGDEYRRAVAENPKHYKAQYGIGSVAVQMHQYKQALVAFQSAIAIHHDHIESWYGIAEAAKHLNDFPRAMAAYQTSLKINPRQSIAWFRIGEIHEISGRYEQAAIAYQKALRNNPAYTAATVALKRVHARQNRQPRQ